MTGQIAFTAEDSLVKAIDELAERIERSRSETLNAIVWVGIQRLKANPPKNFGELIESVSAGTGATMRSEPGFTQQQPRPETRPFIFGEDQKITLPTVKETVKPLFQKTLNQAIAIGSSGRVKVFHINGRKEYILDTDPKPIPILKIGETADQTIIGIDEQMDGCQIDVTYNRNEQGTAIIPKKSPAPKEAGLTEARILEIVGRFLSGEIQ
jgi:hypothetical protein